MILAYLATIVLARVLRRVSQGRFVCHSGFGAVIFAYADPPYPGQGHRYEEKCEVDHRELLARLIREYPDGWALSTSVPALRWVWPLCPDRTRCMSWVKPFAVFKPGVGVAYAWEPVLVWGGRKRTRQQPTIHDWVSASITLRKGLVGAKPEKFCQWVLEVLNVQPGDTVDDIFPGTGSMGRALAARFRQLRLVL